MDICPNCKSKLITEEKSSGRCFSCGAKIESTLPKEDNRINHLSTDNTTAKAIKICGIIIIILGTIFSFIIASETGKEYEFSLLHFLVPEAISVISGILFIGFSEIIKLLEDIKNKLK